MTFGNYGFFFLEGQSCYIIQAGVQWCHLSSLQLQPPGFLVAGITGGARHHAWLIFVFLVEMGFCHVGQGGLELLTPGDMPTLASHMLGLQV